MVQHSLPSLVEGPINRTLLHFGLPIFFTNALQSLNGTINSIWVGRYLGEAALAATSNANTVMLLLIGIISGLASAASILIGKRVGAHDLIGAKRAFGTSVTCVWLISSSLCTAGLIWAEFLLVSMSTPVDSVSLAVAYMRVYFLALPFTYVYTLMMSALAGVGDSKTPLHFMLLAVALDIALNPLFIFGLGPIPRLGVAGSALATVVSQAFVAAMMIARLYQRQHLLCLSRTELPLLRIDAAIAGELFRKGVPIGAQITLLSASNVLMISLVNEFGVDTAAAFGAAVQLWHYAVIPSVAIGIGVSAMTAQNIGANAWDRVASIARVGALYTVALTGSVILLLELLDHQVFALYMPTGSPALDIAIKINRIATPAFLFIALSNVLFAVMRASGAVMAPLIITLFSLYVIRFPLATLLLERWHENAIWWSYPISALLAVTLAGSYYKFGDWRSRERLPALPV